MTATQNGRVPKMDKEVWVSPSEMRDLRTNLGLSIEAAAARVAASVERGRPSLQVLQTIISNIESGKDGFVSLDVQLAIRRGLGLRQVDKTLLIQAGTVTAALNQSGFTLAEATDRIQEFAEATKADATTTEMATDALRAATDLVVANGSFVSKCSEGGGLTSGLNQHAKAKHGAVVEKCDKCMAFLSRLETHVEGCEQCMAAVAWREARENAQSKMRVSLDAAKMLSAVLGRSLYKFSASTAHQRRQLFGVTA